MMTAERGEPQKELPLYYSVTPKEMVMLVAASDSWERNSIAIEIMSEWRERSAKSSDKVLGKMRDWIIEQYDYEPGSDWLLDEIMDYILKELRHSSKGSGERG